MDGYSAEQARPEVEQLWSVRCDAVDTTIEMVRAL